LHSAGSSRDQDKCLAKICRRRALVDK
jgi:hypothetical protein